METIEQVKISDAEWEVMRVIWTLGEANAQEVIGALVDHLDWKPATVKTLLGRLVKKEVLATEADGKRFIYRPLVSEDATVRSATATLFGHICAKRVGHTIAELIEESELTFDDLDLIAEMVAAKRPHAVKEIACNCIPGQCNCKEHQINK